MAPQNLATLRRIALNQARLESSKGSMRGKLKRAAWDPRYLEKLINATATSEMRLPWLVRPSGLPVSPRPCDSVGNNGLYLRRTDMRRSIGALVMALALGLTAPVIMAQQEVKPAAKGHSMRVLTQQPLTLETAKRAIDSLIMLREKYRDQKFKGSQPGPAGVIEGMKNSAVRERILADLKKYGFDSIEDWVGKFVSTGMAISYVQRNKDGAFDRKIEQIRQNSNMTPQMKKRLLAIMTALVPPKGNAEVARQLLADPEYARKAAKLMRKQPPKPNSPAR